MANVPVKIVKTLEPNAPSEGFTFTAAAANDTVQIEWDGKDTQTTVLVTAAAACELTVKAGDSLQAVNDQVIAVEKDKHLAFSLDSGRFKNLRGDLAGKVVMVPSGAVSLAVVETRV